MPRQALKFPQKKNSGNEKRINLSNKQRKKKDGQAHVASNLAGLKKLPFSIHNLRIKFLPRFSSKRGFFCLIFKPRFLNFHNFVASY